VVLISFSKHTRKDFQFIIAFGHSAIITHNCCLFHRTWCWKDTSLVEHSANVSHRAMGAVYRYIHL